jgi:hypothetical protein
MPHALTARPPRASLQPRSSNTLRGTLPPELGAGWVSAEDVNLSSNNVTGPLMQSWGRMSRLKRLELA